MTADKFFTFLIVIFVFYAVIVRPAVWLYKQMFPKIEGLALKTEEEMNTIRKVQLFNIANIDKKYSVLGMIESFDIDKTQAKEKLQLQALALGGNAVINVISNIDNNVKGSVGSVAGMPRMVEGRTSTVTTYHYEGTAVKLLTKA
jgi:uncharacterized protein YbjQ (UPF0145 family)